VKILSGVLHFISLSIATIEKDRVRPQGKPWKDQENSDSEKTVQEQKNGPNLPFQIAESSSHV
jgi:hypothetical protein